MRGKVNPLLVATSCAALLIVFAFPIESYSQQKAYSRRELLQTIRENSKDNSISISDFARLITQNGVDFELTPQDEAALRKAGAVGEVIALIRSNFRPPRSLVVKSSPADCQVLIDGQSRGTTSATGMLVVRNLVGPHRIMVQKKNYRDEQRTVTVLPGGLVETFNLTPSPAKLTVTVNVEGAQIAIQNAGTYTDKIAELELAPASYEVEVSKPGYWPETKTIVLSPGFPYSWPVVLRKMSVDDTLAQVKKLTETSNCSGAIGVASMIPATEPASAKSEYFIGACLYNAGLSDRALPYMRRAVNAGEAVSINLLEKHGGSWNGKTLSLVRLTFHRDSFEYNSVDYPDQSFSAAYANIRELSIKPPNSRLYLKVRAKLPKNKKETLEDFELYSTDAAATGVLVTCEGCPAKMRFALQLLQQFRGGG
jgi:hypothetical protein